MAESLTHSPCKQHLSLVTEPKDQATWTLVPGLSNSLLLINKGPVFLIYITL